MAQRSTGLDVKASAQDDEIHYVDEPCSAPLLKTSTQHDILLRLDEVLRMIPVSKASWYAGVKKGIYPPPIKLGSRTVAWRLSDIVLVIAGAWHARASA